MVRRLVENDYFSHRGRPTRGQLRFCFTEMRTPELLQELARAYPIVRKQFIRMRPLLNLAEPGKEDALKKALVQEENKEREADREYWIPLKRELERLRHKRRK